MSDLPESCNAIEEPRNEITVNAAEKIEKLTKYLHGNWEKSSKKWEKYNESVASFEPSLYGWKNLQTQKSKSLDCPKCLWQCGSIYVRGDYLLKEVCCGENCYQ